MSSYSSEPSKATNLEGTIGSIYKRKTMTAAGKRRVAAGQKTRWTKFWAKRKKTALKTD
jgi:hypothetical protein